MCHAEQPTPDGEVEGGRSNEAPVQSADRGAYAGRSRPACRPRGRSHSILGDDARLHSLGCDGKRRLANAATLGPSLVPVLRPPVPRRGAVVARVADHRQHRPLHPGHGQVMSGSPPPSAKSSARLAAPRTGPLALPLDVAGVDGHDGLVAPPRPPRLRLVLAAHVRDVLAPRREPPHDFDAAGPPVRNAQSQLPWGVILAAAERHRPSKVVEFDEAVTWDKPSLSWVTGVFVDLRRRDSTRPLWDCSHAQALALLKMAAYHLDLPYDQVSLYMLRHGGASNDALHKMRSIEQIKQLGRCLSDRSVKRYQKATRAQQLVSATTLETRASRRTSAAGSAPASSQARGSRPLALLGRRLDADAPARPAGRPAARSSSGACHTSPAATPRRSETPTASSGRQLGWCAPASARTCPSQSRTLPRA